MPFLAPALPWIGAGLGALTGIGKGKAQDRAQTADYNQNADRTRLGMAQFNAAMPGLRASNAVRGDILGGVQDYQIGGEGRNLSSTGGLRPSLLSANTRGLGRAMNRQAYLSQLGQPQADNPYSALHPTPPPKAGLMEKIGIGAGFAAPFLGMVGGGDALNLPGLSPTSAARINPGDFEDIYKQLV